jgi:hypothetical protein
MSRTRSGWLSITLWTFGLATSLFLLGMWGRTVVIDSATIEESARSIVDADIAADRINAWFEEGLATGADIDSDTARSVVHEIKSRPEYHDAVDTIIAGFVHGLFADEDDAASVDLHAALAPLVPVVVTELAHRDVVVEAAHIEEVLDDAGVIDLDAGEAAFAAFVVADARVFLSQVVLASLVALLITGSLATFLADERASMVRTLSLRVVMAAMSYAMILRLAGWALDPQRGRSAIAGGGSVLLNSNTQVFVLVGVLAAMVSVVVTWRLSQRRIRTEPAPASERSTSDDDTRELVSV